MMFILRSVNSAIFIMTDGTVRRIILIDNLALATAGLSGIKVHKMARKVNAAKQSGRADNGGLHLDAEDTA